MRIYHCKKVKPSKLLMTSLIWASLLGTRLTAQQMHIENQYFVNPWVYNSARLGESDYTEFSLSYKQQWLGLEDAPSTARLGLQTPLSNQFKLGGYLWRQSEGPFQQIEGLVSVAYKLSLDQTSDHHLRFGMSWGVGNRSVNVSVLDVPNDPGLTLLPSSHTYLQGNFGLSYQWKGFQVGLAVPYLLRDDITNEEGFGTSSLGLPEYYIANASYTWETPISGFKFTPQLFYHRNSAQAGDQWEGAFTTTYQEQVWAGVSYRQDYGASLHIGGAPSKRLDISYVYSLPSLGAEVPNASHEIVMRLRLGRGERKDKQKTNHPEETDDLNTVSLGKQEEIKEEIYLEPIDPPKEIEEDYQENFKSDSSEHTFQKNYVDQTTKLMPPAKPSTKIDSLSQKELVRVKDLEGRSFSLESGYYLVCGAFRSRRYANRFATKVESKGFQATIIMVPSRGYYYVYTGYTSDQAIAVRRKESIRKMMGFQDTWLLVVE